MPLHVSGTCAHHEEVKIALYSLWYHHIYWWPSCAQVERVLSQPLHETATYRCDDTRGCVMQFWPPDDEHLCLKHVEAWNKLIVKQKFCASCWLITEINILRCTVSKTSKFPDFVTYKCGRFASYWAFWAVVGGIFQFLLSEVLENMPEFWVSVVCVTFSILKY